MKEFLQKQKAKSRLFDAFRKSGIHLTYKADKTIRYVFPKVHSIKFFDERTEYVFTLPNGVDPKEVRKKQYVFQQVFGRNTEIRGDLKRFVMNVYVQSLPQIVKYNFREIQPVIKDMKLPIICGKNLYAEYVAYDMRDHPHLLLAGETGSGKSSQLRSILTTMIQAMPPDRLQLYLSDMKKSEFHVFRNVKYVDSVSTRGHEILSVLQQVKTEMVRREEVLDRLELTHIDDVMGDKYPYIVVAIDEVALLKKEKEVMEILEEISSVGRTNGVFLILSMQRPDRDVLDGKLKNNLTIRMGFKVEDRINSRIIGTPGAEEIDHPGRMLMKKGQLQEIQAPFLDIEPAKKILANYKTRVKRNKTTWAEKTTRVGKDSKPSAEELFNTLE